MCKMNHIFLNVCTTLLKRNCILIRKYEVGLVIGEEQLCKHFYAQKETVCTYILYVDGLLYQSFLFEMLFLNSQIFLTLFNFMLATG